jgi:hypothetical protein
MTKYSIFTFAVILAALVPALNAAKSNKADVGFKLIKSVKTKDCNPNSNTKKCKLDLSDFGINDTDEIDFQLKPNGRTIKCFKSGAKVNSNRGNSWHAECDGFGSANLVVKGENELGESLLYGTIADGNEIFRLFPNAMGENEVTWSSVADYPDETQPVDPRWSEERNLALSEQQLTTNGTYAEIQLWNHYQCSFSKTTSYIFCVDCNSNRPV